MNFDFHFSFCCNSMLKSLSIAIYKISCRSVIWFSVKNVCPFLENLWTLRNSKFEREKSIDCNCRKRQSRVKKKWMFLRFDLDFEPNISLRALTRHYIIENNLLFYSNFIFYLLFSCYMFHFLLVPFPTKVLQKCSKV